MIKVISLFLITSTFACELKPNEYISLSGPVSILLRELDLLKDKSLKAISSFHPITKDEFSGKRVSGGLFISSKYLKSLKDPIVFYDSSRELKQIFQAGIEIQTKGEISSLIDSHLESLKPFTKDCESKIKEIQKNVKTILKSIKDYKFQKSYLFYLGKLGERKTNLLVSNDLFVRVLKNKAKLKTYPSDSMYVPISQKIKKDFSDAIEIGISDGKTHVKKIEDKRFNISFQGILTPGYSQILFLENWPKFEKELK
jgi:hypothetical protein